MFSVVTHPDRIVAALWTGGGKHYNKCTWKSTSRVPFNWHGMDVRVPVPLDTFLTSMYGKDYMTPQPWAWNVGPFKVGACVSGGRRLQRSQRRQSMDVELYLASREWLRQRAL